MDAGDRRELITVLEARNGLGRPQRIDQDGMLSGAASISLRSRVPGGMRPPRL
ncbi:hypothetical protein HMPREF9057_00642 [Actinomyces sp. oral taxon 171 str. F0337]|nr:hypothetical protein HMPREF9057_00642 [Actinomyces sp. oral taxon 171 str. F0337]